MFVDLQGYACAHGGIEAIAIFKRAVAFAEQKDFVNMCDELKKGITAMKGSFTAYKLAYDAMRADLQAVHHAYQSSRLKADYQHKVLNLIVCEC
jgi:hypothetical protein